MRDSVTMGSLTDALLLFISTTMVRDSNYDIALEMVKNIRKLRGMSIDEVADMCHVSKASISRFCRFIGFSNFKEFKEYSELDFSIKSDYTKQFLKELDNDMTSAIDLYKESLIENVDNVLNEKMLHQIESVAKEINRHKRTAFFGQYFFQNVGLFFQSKMMLMGKYVEAFTNFDGQMTCAESLNKDSVAIICTVGGSYLTRHDEIWEKIVASGCTIVVITQNTGSIYFNQADYILQCGTRNNEGSGKYAAMMLLDYLIAVYMKHYDE